MYKRQKNSQPSSDERDGAVRWIKRKIFLIISALMIGMSNAIYDEDKLVNGRDDKIEQKENND